MKLLIISHTEHYKDTNGTIVGWGSTITELNFLSEEFDEIYHIGVLKNEVPPPSSLPYTNRNIHFIPIAVTGGGTIFQKFNIVWNAPSTIYKVFKTLNKVDIFQLRTPTGIGVYLIPLLTLFSRKKGWFKYAGNWIQVNAPFGYALQRWFLKKQKRIVTINGKWPNQPAHCYSFENPCLKEIDRREGKSLITTKEYSAPYTFCFVGRLEDQKGVRRIIEAFTLIKIKDKVDTVHMIGNGKDLSEYKDLASRSGISFKFHGFLGFEEVKKIYKISHFFLLPSSASEGFPKVIAEAMNFGCIPIVSDVSAIGQYVKDKKNGFIISPNSSAELKITLEQIIGLPSNALIFKAKNGYEIVSNFTYDYYINRIISQIV